MVSVWNDMVGLLDSKVDEYLGDTITYKVGAEAAIQVQGFVFNEDDTTDMDGAHGTARTVKIRNTLVPKPAPSSHRLQHPKLGEGWFKPMGPEIRNDGRYWLFGVQKA